MQRLLFDAAWLPDGWAQNVEVRIDTNGSIERVTPNSISADVERVSGIAIPGMVNAHSHAFQRAIVGLTEKRTGGSDSFWTWREVMYRFALSLDPDDVHAIAAQLYGEMLAAGYTHVVEFHYLHHAPDGRPYARRSAMAEAIIAAASEAGIGLTIAPVLYMTGNFDARATDEQRRFLNDPEGLFAIIEELAATNAVREEQAKLGLALHSLRAVPPAAIAEALRLRAAHLPSGPVHIHIAEQEREVSDCLAATGKRPVEWLLDNQPVDPNWCLVHATHMSADETERLAATGAIVALCPTTEANLGDGLFPVQRYIEAGGTFAIGSDSHVTVDPAEEMRWLDYGQRLVLQQRGIVASSDEQHPGAALWRRSLAGGALAAGHGSAGIAPGAGADILVLDPEHPTLCGRDGDALLDSLVFGGRGAIARVMAAGKWVAENGRHSKHVDFASRYRQAISRLQTA